ncbi:MAG: hypothetical protein AAGM67_03145, partial [Bacteroidota bacterium]
MMQLINVFRIFVMAVIMICHQDLKAQLIVSSSLDSGPGSLRQAILDAQSISGPNDISFAVDSIFLNSGLPVINHELTIDGLINGVAAVIHYQGPNRVFTVNNSQNISIQNIDLSNQNAGQVGKGIYVQNSSEIDLSSLT